MADHLHVPAQKFPWMALEVFPKFPFSLAVYDLRGIYNAGEDIQLKFGLDSICQSCTV
jgi:hypothetical protein